MVLCSCAVIGKSRGSLNASTVMLWQSVIVTVMAKCLRRTSVYSIDTLDQEMIHVLPGEDGAEAMTVHHATQISEQLETHELIISGTFYLIFSDGT